MSQVLNITKKDQKTYATKENLLKVIKEKGLEEYRYLVVRTEDESARFTAIFLGAELLHTPVFGSGFTIAG